MSNIRVKVDQQECKAIISPNPIQLPAQPHLLLILLHLLKLFLWPNQRPNLLLNLLQVRRGVLEGVLGEDVDEDEVLT